MKKLLILLIFSLELFAQCDFKTSDYLNELDDFSKIKEISVLVNKNKKWTTNYFKLTLSKKNYIKAKYKKKFNADIKVKYSFGGECTFPAKIRINGDMKDHVALEKGYPFPSLDVKLKEGNIANKVRFKLLRPETREGNKEIYFTQLLRIFGFIAPITANINVKQGPISSKMLFQEKVAKELVESLGRRENAIFEGDETYLVGYKNFETFSLDKKFISLSKLSNRKWALKGSSSIEIAKHAFLKLQNIYMLQRYTKIDPTIINYEVLNLDNSDYLNQLKLFDILMFSANATHGLFLNNRKFLWNSFLNNFEYIYYDGNVGGRTFDSRVPPFLFFLRNTTEYAINNALERMKSFDVETYKENLQKCGLSNEEIKEGENFLHTVIQNIALIKKRKKSLANDHRDDTLSFSTARKAFLDRVFKEKNLFELATIKTENNNNVLLEICNKKECKQKYYKKSDLIDIMAKEGKVFSLDTMLIPQETYQTPVSKEIKSLELDKFTMMYTNTSQVIHDPINKMITFKPTTSHDWLLIKNGMLKGYHIKLLSLEGNATSTLDQRFNPYGLTGCLTFYNIDFNHSEITANKSWCEDSVNIVSSRGKINHVDITGAQADALDIDFSKLDITNLTVQNAGNDCYDVSSGDYYVGNAELSHCGDKAISIGEKSTAHIIKANVEHAEIGISVKDSSIVLLDDFNAINTKSCTSVYRKKQEFDGAVLSLKKHNCQDIGLLHDDESKIIIEGK